MANIKKTFNFRNGVQVDDDNLIVNQTGLVGIGTTVPTEALDVRGKVKVIADPNVTGSGEINATTGIITSLTVTDLTVNGNDYSSGVIGVGISVGTAGIITATEPTGIVTYFGDGKELLNLPTSQWLDKDVGLGYTSIYAQGGVGVGTVDPRFTFQVSGNNDLTSFEEGVGINDKGGIVATGVITATTFKGNVDGFISSGLSTITQLQSTNANVTGVVTATTFKGDVSGDVVSGISTITTLQSTGVNVSGVATAGGFVGPLTGNVSGQVTGNLAGNINSIGISTFHTIKITGFIDGDSVSGILTTGDLNSASSRLGIATAVSLNIQNKLGVGLNNPTSDIQVYNTGIATCNVVGEQFSVIQLGQKDNIGIGESVAQIKFGVAPKVLDIINGDTGNVNNIIHGGSFTGINTGSFNWIYGQGYTTLMSLDYTGKLGVNKDNPQYPLDVVGVATFSSNVFVKSALEVNTTLNVNGGATIGSTLDVTSNATVGGNLNVTGSFNYPSPVPDAQLPDLITSNIYSLSGVSTIRGGVDLGSIQVGGTNGVISGVSTIGILTAAENIPLAMGVYAPTAKAVFNRLGVGNTDPQNALDVSGTIQATQYLGVGNLGVGAAVDFSNAGRGITEPSLQNRMFMLPPKVTTSERGNLAGLAAGAIVYNTTTNKLQVYNGSSWANLH